MDGLVALWGQLSARNEPLPAATAWLTIAAAALLVLVPGLWRIGRHVITIAHEGGHAVVATLSGRRLGGIRLHSDTSGLTVSSGRPRGPGMVLTLLAGYPAPALLGLGAARMLSLGYDIGLLWLLLVALALLLVQIRNWFGLWSVLVTAAVIFGITWFASPPVQGVFALLITAFLLLGAVRTVAELHRSRSRSRGSASDADQLARLTHIPGVIWVAVFLVATVACAGFAGRFLGLLA
ncbi:M50 family peptidase [Cryobacterium sp. TMT1-21]|uniref:M50 family peptidase n=1 Tax=Cryobacterium shii TaxID=1259235 RepID=A0AAQ2C8A3_9MICO|nr:MULTISPECIES: M50 family metallopeptidase [Cryobacterium]TFC51694.1 M50 family peptidase [Cryobacterium shii]TFC89438.1 M50 family peptidase [Cryobacterium sp. TmT2-59]TFD13661.1 M50 family peptidase [Cryobacterium sp. TMT4-10]TFD15976.1 M50 family peptidase [Cryobacterium sp. TMT1-21]TFD27067.1 M50 family peptidase [Cryobacterium sp. TMT2-23]